MVYWTVNFLTGAAPNGYGFVITKNGVAMTSPSSVPVQIGSDRNPNYQISGQAILSNVTVGQIIRVAMATTSGTVPPSITIKSSFGYSTTTLPSYGASLVVIRLNQ